MTEGASILEDWEQIVANGEIIGEYSRIGKACIPIYKDDFSGTYFNMSYENSRWLCLAFREWCLSVEKYCK